MVMSVVVMEVPIFGVVIAVGKRQNQHCHSGMRRLNSGLPEFSKYDCPSRQQPTWMAQARNP
jgi:hypothetical protein